MFGFGNASSSFNIAYKINNKQSAQRDSNTHILRLPTKEDDSLKTNNILGSGSSNSSSGISSCHNEELCAFGHNCRVVDDQTLCSSSTAEIFELRSLNNTVLHHHELPEDAKNNDDDVFEARRAFCYMPERLVRSQQYRIVSSTPPCQPSFDSLWSGARRKFDRNYQNYSIDAVQMDHELAKAVDLSAHDSLTDSINTAQQTTYSDELDTRNLMRHPCVHAMESNSQRCGWCSCKIEGRKSCQHHQNLREQSSDSVLVDQSSSFTIGKNQVTGIPLATSGAKHNQEDLAYISFKYELTPKYLVNEVTSILSELEKNPNSVKELLLEDEDRFLTCSGSRHDCLSRLVLTIEPDQQQQSGIVQTLMPHFIKKIKVVSQPWSAMTFPIKQPNSCGLELKKLHEKIKRLKSSGSQLKKEIDELKADFSKDEEVLDTLLSGIAKFRNEMYELKFTNDLIKLLKDDLENVSNKNWPFKAGHISYGTKELNLII